ncbi:hypothetical protein BJ508DRAFT_416623 [Ascobolus immersus RN42]|uniref:HNH nuclease domain-containing protein n=1 Tax=Ascobolus immersus RN42 TaxID=1160509 RepID=A0A3N4HWV3_ASCIM|nr:hypothetical protein BJ508DRAFT_416623 [Ascobolus immersus RN42]
MAMRDTPGSKIRSPTQIPHEIQAQVLRRDGHRCCISKMRKIDSTPPPRPLRQFHNFSTNISRPGTAEVALQVAHIIPTSFDPASPDFGNSDATHWYFLNLISPSISTHLSPSNFNHPSNLITLDVGIHQRFGALTLGLEPCYDKQVVDYKVESIDRINVDFEHPEVRFDPGCGEVYVVMPDHSSEDVTLPDPQLLRIQLASVRILCLSGHSEAIERVMDGCI